jgi:hypothetical protein
MMYALRLEAQLTATVKEAWSAWSDMTRFPEWDPREEIMRLDGPFAVGTTGFSKQTGPRAGGPVKITLIERPARYVVETPLPGGKLELDHLIEDAGDGRTRLVKRYLVQGPMALAFRLVFAKSIRAEMPATFAALEQEIARRRVTTGA